MSRLCRLENSRTLMDRWLRQNSARAVQYGSWDCALMAAAHKDNITASALYAAHAGKYDSADSSAAYLSSLGIADLAGLASSILGDPLANKKMAQCGDIVTFDTELGPALGIVALCGMRIVALSPAKTGFISLPLRLATAAWRV